MTGRTSGIPGTASRSLAPGKRRVVENDEYTAFLRRAIRALARRVCGGDIEAITGMAQLSGDLDYAIRIAVIGLRAKGYSWTEIGTRLGVTRQAAQQRYGGDVP